jgi:DNA polymerase III subunit epsilon
MLILGLDFETSGVNPEECRAIEAGLCLWDVERRRAVKQIDFFIKPDIIISPEDWAEVTPVHGITQELIDLYGVMDQEALVEINNYALQAEAVVAHNGTLFDKLLHEAWNRRYGFQQPPAGWIDTRLDVKEPLVGKLICIAAQKGFLNPFPHQALSDVNTMLRILDEEDLAAVVARSRIPNIYIEALVSFDRKDEAKDRGYFWNGYKPVKPTKQWLKMIKECDFEKEAAEAPFRIRRA